MLDDEHAVLLSGSQRGLKFLEAFIDKLEIEHPENHI